MMKRMSLVSYMDMSVVGSSRNASENNESLGVNHDQIIKAQTTSLNTSLSNAMLPQRMGVPFKVDVYTWKYFV